MALQPPKPPILGQKGPGGPSPNLHTSKTTGPTPTKLVSSKREAVKDSKLTNPSLTSKYQGEVIPNPVDHTTPKPSCHTPLLSIHKPQHTTASEAQQHLLPCSNMSPKNACPQQNHDTQAHQHTQNKTKEGNPVNLIIRLYTIFPFLINIMLFSCKQIKELVMYKQNR